MNITTNTNRIADAIRQNDMDMLANDNSVVNSCQLLKVALECKNSYATDIYFCQCNQRTSVIVENSSLEDVKYYADRYDRYCEFGPCK